MMARFVGLPLKALGQAWHGEQASRLIAIPYDSLASRPKVVMRELYRLLGEQPFEHDFENLSYEEVDFDARMSMPGLHRVSGPVRVRKRRTILPPELFAQYDREFWKAPGGNPRNVVIL